MLTSSVHGSTCSWPVCTWYASLNASTTTFQFAGITVVRYERNFIWSKWYGSKSLGQRIEEVEQRLHVRVEVDEHEPAPPLGAHRAQREVVGDRMEVGCVDDLDDSAVERVAPPVERATERPVGDVPAALGELSAAVQARIRKRGDRVGPAAHDEDGLVADRVLDVVADARDLLLAARDLPDPRPQPLVLEVEELARQIPLFGDQAVPAVVARSQHHWGRNL